MVCYARPAIRFAAILAVALLAFSRPLGHFFDTAAFIVAATAAAAGTAVVTVLVVAAFMSTRRRRAAAGACVSCRFRCQHAMTEPPRRLWLVTTADRRPAGTVVTPRWPDRPIHRAAPAPHRPPGPASHPRRRERAA